MYKLILLTNEETHIFSLAFMSFHIQFSPKEILVSHSIMRIILIYVCNRKKSSHKKALGIQSQQGEIQLLGKSLAL